MLYAALGILPDGQYDAHHIRAAFRRRALSTHPDKGGSAAAFQLALQAFETLSDPHGRARYDRSLLAGVDDAPHSAPRAKRPAARRAAETQGNEEHPSAETTGEDERRSARRAAQTQGDSD